MRQQRLPSLTEILLLTASLLVIIFVVAHQLDLPIQLAFIGCWFATMGFGKYLGYTYHQLQKGIIGGVTQGMEAILILISVGALIGSWMAGGIVPNIIYLGLSVMDPSLFLPAAFIICAITSLATGTSFGTAGTAGIAMMGIGAGFGLPPALVAGAAISGAYVGDKLSPLSDTTVMTASMCQVNLIAHIKSMLYVSVPACVIAASAFLLVGLGFEHDGSTGTAQQVMDAIAGHYTIGWYMLLPALIVIGMLMMRMPSFPVICFGAVLGVIWAMMFEQASATTAFNSLYHGNFIDTDVEFLQILLNRGGITSMLSTILLVILAMGLGGLMESIGVLASVCNSLQHWATSTGRLGLATLLSGVLGNALGGAAYVSIMTASTITSRNYEQLGIDRRVLSRNVESGGTVTTPMIPWTDGGIFMATTLGVSTLTYLPFLWYHWLVIGISILYSYAGWYHFKPVAIPEVATEAN
ncbi:Na+/H+ antiporter NhaC [Alteromonas lipolytica]|uniref:Na+/H+ antiporter NhaC n=1 Tax=Alteromonas lipolytica TaxID=1856405 RepID=A0A1E8FAN6_9ALTE|nr:Na+/H+ antiporter NhaC [Alteromonas lipolytica]OFI32992.1 Na+/H+ antiporter NhaC [Alteromonas lipolytica]GGF63512.1 malate-2H(+)/Na(+)-lactate antiporter [Alteromonas lipolytica]